MNRVARIFDNFDDAMNVHKKIFTMVIEKGYVTLRDFNNIVNNQDEIFVGDMYDTHGWTYLCGTIVEEYKDNKFIIVMPEMIEFGMTKKHRR